MIRSLVDFAINNRFLVIVLAVLALLWGIISFERLPVEAYPDVANNYVQIITQWSGRAAEEVEQQVTVPIEVVMNGLPHLQHLRSTSIFGLSSVMLIFDDESDNDWNRQKTLERLSQDFLGSVPQDMLGSLVPAGDPTLEIEQDHGVVLDVLGQQAEIALTLAQLLLEVVGTSLFVVGAPFLTVAAFALVLQGRRQVPGH